MEYSAKKDYQSEESAKTYEQRSMYKGFIGKRRKQIETRVITKLVDELPDNIIILDCPCGNGRWFPIVAKKAKKIIAIDVSSGMVHYASKKQLEIEIEVFVGDASNLTLENEAVDYVFCYALMKHIPLPLQYKILKEFARVSRCGIICSFAVLTAISYPYWQWRHPPESYPIIKEELINMAKYCDLKLEKLIKVSQPLIGLEYFAKFSKK